MGALDYVTTGSKPRGNGERGSESTDRSKKNSPFNSFNRSSTFDFSKKKILSYTPYYKAS